MNSYELTELFQAGRFGSPSSGLPGIHGLHGVNDAFTETHVDALNLGQAMIGQMQGFQ